MVPADSPILRTDLTKALSEIASMFDHVAERYDPMDLIMTDRMDRVWMKTFRNATVPLSGEKVPDMVAGTGASCAMSAKAGAEVAACDLSEGMVEVGRRRRPDTEFIQGSAVELSPEETSPGVVAISWGLRNILDPGLTLREMARVVRPKRRFIVCEFSTPPDPPFHSFYECYQSSALKYLAEAFSSDEAAYDYFVKSTRDWPDQRIVGEIIARNGRASVEYRSLTGGTATLHRMAKPLP